MTNKELQEWLSNFPPMADIYIEIEGKTIPVGHLKVSPGLANWSPNCEWKRERDCEERRYREQVNSIVII